MDSYLLYGKQFSTIPFPNKKWSEESFKGFKLVSEYDIDIDRFIYVLKRRYYEDLGNGNALSRSFRYIYFIYNNNNVIYYRLNGNIRDLKRWLNEKRINKDSDFYPDYVIYSRDISYYLEETHNVTLYDLVDSVDLNNSIEINEFDGKIRSTVDTLIDQYKNGDYTCGACMVDIYSKEELLSLLSF